MRLFSVIIFIIIIFFLCYIFLMSRRADVGRVSSYIVPAIFVIGLVLVILGKVMVFLAILALGIILIASGRVRF
ncbi:MAG: hypothetical protein Fur0020_15800 [Thermodesulfovibrionia bacterium]